MDEWKKQLEDLRKVYKDYVDDVNNTKYDPIAPSTGSSSSSGGSGGGSKPRYILDSMYTTKTVYDQYDNPYTEYYYNGMQIVQDKAPDGEWHWKYVSNGQFATYAKGGIADFTGPAWLDGTKTKPERILSPYQTELFEDLISTLHGIRVNASSMPAIGFESASNGQTFTFGDIVINVDRLDETSDYELIAEQIMEHIMDMMSHGAAVGGIRITR